MPLVSMMFAVCRVCQKKTMSRFGGRFCFGNVQVLFLAVILFPERHSVAIRVPSRVVISLRRSAWRKRRQRWSRRMSLVDRLREVIVSIRNMSCDLWRRRVGMNGEEILASIWCR